MSGVCVSGQPPGEVCGCGWRQGRRPAKRSCCLLTNDDGHDRDRKPHGVRRCRCRGGVRASCQVVSGTTIPFDSFFPLPESQKERAGDAHGCRLVLVMLLCSNTTPSPLHEQQLGANCRRAKAVSIPSTTDKTCRARGPQALRLGRVATSRARA